MERVSSCSLLLVLFTVAYAHFACSSSDAGPRRSAAPEGEDAGATPEAGIRVDADLVFEPPEVTPIEPVGDRRLVSGDVPTDVGDLFTEATPDASRGPELVYPSPGTMFPPNLARILFQWTAARGNAFHLRFETASGTLDVYTDGRHESCEAAATGARCWESDAESLLPYMNAARGQPLRLTLGALELETPAVVWQSRAYTLEIAPKNVEGAIYYWSTTVQGIRRGTLDERAPANYLTPDEANGQCVACHTLSRSGKRLAVSFPGDLLGVVDVVETIPPPVSYGPAQYGYRGDNTGASWITFSPDETALVTASQGLLVVRDVQTAAPVGDGTLGLPDGIYGSMPDWAPDGRHLVFTATPGQPQARHLHGSSLAWFRASGRQFNGYEIIAESRGLVAACDSPNGRETYANPMFSPDSQWLVFSRGDCESEGDPSAEIILAHAVSGAPQYALARANRRVGEATESRLQNGMPTWAPSSDQHIGWIAFTSIRDYGLVLAPGSQVGHRMRQLWVAAVNFSKVGSEDPSYPAFRLPAQDLTENNHRPFWTVDVLPPDWTPVVR